MSFPGPEPRTPYTSILGAPNRTGGVLPEDHPLTSEDPPLRSQELADLGGGPAGVDTLLHPIGQVEQRHIGGQGKGGLQ